MNAELAYNAYVKLLRENERLRIENQSLKNVLQCFVDNYRDSKRAWLGNGYAYKFYAIAEQALSKKPEEK